MSVWFKIKSIARLTSGENIRMFPHFRYDHGLKIWKDFPGLYFSILHFVTFMHINWCLMIQLIVYITHDYIMLLSEELHITFVSF